MRKKKKHLYLSDLILVMAILMVAAAYITKSPTLLRLWKYNDTSTGFSIKLVFLITVALAVSAKTYRFVIRWAQKNKMFHSRITKIDQMSGEEFEDYLKLQFEKKGYKVKYTPLSHDYGADLICKNGHELLVVQAKRYKNKVGNKAVQEIVAAKGYYGADRCMVITNSYFTAPARRLAEGNGVELKDRDDLKRDFIKK